MASLIESLTQSLTPDLVGQIGKTVGLDNSLVNKGLGVVGPLVTGALAITAQSPLGIDGLMKLMPQAPSLPATGRNSCASCGSVDRRRGRRNRSR